MSGDEGCKRAAEEVEASEEEPAKAAEVAKGFGGGVRGDDGRLFRQNTEYGDAEERHGANLGHTTADAAEEPEAEPEAMDTDEPAPEPEAEAPAIVRQSTDDLEGALVDAEFAKDEAAAALAARQAEKEAAAEEPTDEKAEEADAPTDEESADEEDDFTPLADGSKVACAYGSVFAQKRRRWFGAEIITYNANNKKYTIKWKFLPAKGAKALYRVSSEKVVEVTQEQFDAAPAGGVGFLGLHRQSTFINPGEDRELAAGDFCAVAYGDEATVQGVAHKLLWYAAKIVGVADDKYTVEWKFPFKDANTYEAPKDRVQAITNTEYAKSTRRKGKKVVYGFVGFARLESSCGLTTAVPQAETADA